MNKTQADIVYRAPTTHDARGRNGFMLQTGLAITLVGQEVWLEAITTRGRSEAARLVIPRDSLKATIDALTDIEGL